MQSSYSNGLCFLVIPNVRTADNGNNHLIRRQDSFIGSWMMVCLFYSEHAIKMFWYHNVISGYKKPLGIYAITGLHVLPIWLYTIKMKVLERFVVYTLPVTVFLLVARFVCGAVELWCMSKHVELLLDRNSHKSSVDKWIEYVTYIV